MAALNFTITRTGDLTKDGSVNYTIETDLVNADFAPGQSKTGTVSWAANETAAKVVTYTTVGNATENPDRYLRLVLSNPVNGVIGTDRATINILDDEVPAPATGEYVPDLPYGGVLLGAAIVDGAVGNVTCRNSYGSSCAVIMYLEHDDPIVAIAFENRVDHFPLGSTAGGYSDKIVVNSGSGNRPLREGDSASDIVARARGGDMRWRVAKVIGPDPGATGNLVLEKISGTNNVRWAGETETIVACARDASWDNEYKKCGGTLGSGDHAPPRFSGSANGGGYPTIWFKSPIKPSDWGWVIGDRIAFIEENLDDKDTGPGASGDAMQRPYGTSEYMGVNMCHRLQRPLTKSTYRYLKYSGVQGWGQSNGPDRSQRYAPAFIVGHRGSDNVMHKKGNAYIGDSDPTYAIPTGRVRQTIHIPNDSRWNNRRIIGFDAGIWRTGSGIGGNITLRLYRQGSDATADGTLLGSTQYAAADVFVGGGRNGAADAVPNKSMTNFVANAVLTVQANEVYFLDLDPSVSGYVVGFMLNYTGRSPNLPAGLNKCDHQNYADKIQTRNANGVWSNIGGQTTADQDNYKILGVGLHFKGPA